MGKRVLSYKCSECDQFRDGEPYDFEGCDHVPPITDTEAAVVRELAWDSPEVTAIMGRHQFVTNQPRCQECAERIEAEELHSFDEAMTVVAWDRYRHPDRPREDAETGELLPAVMSIEDIPEAEREDFAAFRAFTKIVGPVTKPE
jgi:hypothetical protein